MLRLIIKILGKKNILDLPVFYLYAYTEFLLPLAGIWKLKGNI